jgi:hypothetical protein
MDARSYAVGGGSFIDSKKTVLEVIVNSSTSLAVVNHNYSDIKDYDLHQGGSHRFL